METIILVGAILAFFLSFLVFNKQNKAFADKVLGCWLAIYGINVLFAYIEILNIKNNFPFPHLTSIASPLPLIHGPFLLLYIKSFVEGLKKFDYKYLFHFIPFVAAVIYLSSIYYFLPVDEKIIIIKNPKEFLDNSLRIFFLLLIFISGPFYVIWGLIVLKRHNNNILNQFSNTEKIEMKWMSYLLISIGIFWFTPIISVIFSDFTEKISATNSTIIIYTMASVIIFFIGFYGIKQTTVFTGAVYHENEIKKQEIKPQDKKNEKSDNQKYKTSGLRDDDAEKYYHKLLSIMEKDKLYLNPELNITDLSKKLNINVNYISQIINQKSEKNFFDFVNSYRVDEFLEQIQRKENETLTLIGIAYDCGFNSKSSFNRIFKKMTGKTPSEYKNYFN